LCRVAPKKESKERPKVEEEEPEEATKKLEKAVQDAKIKWLEETGKKIEPADVEAARKVADELLADDPKLLKALLWKLSNAEGKLKDAVSHCGILVFCASSATSPGEVLL